MLQAGDFEQVLLCNNSVAANNMLLITGISESGYSLHAGIFTKDLDTALLAIKEIEAGGIMVNDSSDYRFDGMPFGGFKAGSMGREGVRFALEEMTQTKVACINISG